MTKQTHMAFGGVLLFGLANYALGPTMARHSTPMAPFQASEFAESSGTVLRFTAIEAANATVVFRQENPAARYRVVEGSVVSVDGSVLGGVLTTPGRVGLIKANFEVVQAGAVVGHGSIESLRPRIEVSDHGFRSTGW